VACGIFEPESFKGKEPLRLDSGEGFWVLLTFQKYLVEDKRSWGLQSIEVVKDGGMDPSLSVGCRIFDAGVTIQHGKSKKVFPPFTAILSIGANDKCNIGQKPACLR